MTTTQPTPGIPTVSDAGILFIPAGYPGPSLRIRHGALQVDLGFGRQIQVSRSGRPRLRRVVIYGRSGWWSFEVPAWLAAVGASWAHLTRKGRVIGTGPADASPDHPRLRAAQAVAHLSLTGLALSRDLIVQKLAAQRRLLEIRFPDQDAAIATLADLEQATAASDRLDEIRQFEAEGAAVYFAAWRSRPLIRFARRDAALLPDHWLRFSGRGSAISGDAQHADTPLNSLLNLTYALLLVETTVAMRSCGLDPGIPLGLHAFERNRASGSLDLLEPVRPIADATVIDVLSASVFTRRDFREQPDGSIHIAPPLVRALLDTMPTLAAAVAPVVERTAQTLADQADLGTLPTPLTGANRSRGRDAHRRRRRSRTSHTKPAVPARCRECGIDVPTGRALCDACHYPLNQARLAGYRDAEAARRADTGEHPSARSVVRQRIADAQRAQWEARRCAEPAGGYSGDPSEFRRLILPRLAGVTTSELVHATRLSPAYCAEIRAGRRVPHVRHWAALQLAGLLG